MVVHTPRCTFFFFFFPANNPFPLSSLTVAWGEAGDSYSLFISRYDNHFGTVGTNEAAVVEITAEKRETTKA